MVPRAEYIAHCETLGIHKSLAQLMADLAEEAAPRWRALAARRPAAASQLQVSFEWALSEQGHDFWSGVSYTLHAMSKTGECK